jgi:hypothetical protein
LQRISYRAQADACQVPALCNYETRERLVLA